MPALTYWTSLHLEFRLYKDPQQTLWGRQTVQSLWGRRAVQTLWGKQADSAVALVL